MMRTYKVGILGATGLVGQRLVERLENHPWFTLSALGASERSAGLRYAEAADWRLSAVSPEGAANHVVRRCEPSEFDDCDLVLSALDTAVARKSEPRFAAAGLAVVSNSSAFRQQADVPLVVPEVNPDHLALVEPQRRRNGGGFIVTNPNCSVTGLVLTLAPLHHAFGVRRLVVATMQAVSGAGSEGPRALQMLGNVLPHIPGEEEKMEPELRKILGGLSGERVEPAAMAVSAHCHRVPVLDGHLEAVSVELGSDVTPSAVSAVLADYRGNLGEDDLPSAPGRPVVVRAEADRPQPLLDRDEAGGMSVVVGRVRRCPALGVKFVLLSHNTVRGAAGGTLLNAELLAAKELLPRRGAP